MDDLFMLRGKSKGLTEEQAAKLSGASTIIRTPVPSSPLTGATGVPPSPELAAGVFANMYQPDARAYRQFQVDLATGDFSSPVYDVNVNADSHIVGDELDTEVAHQWRCRDVAASGAVSAWSTAQSFTTSAIYIDNPVNSSPSDTESDVAETPILQSGAFSCVGDTDTHASSDWEVYDAGGELVYSSYEDAENLTALTVPAGSLLENSTYTWRVRHTGAAYGTSAWSTATSFTTLATFALIYGIAKVNETGLSGTWARVDGVGNNIALTGTDFDNHPIWGNIETVTIDGQEMVKIPKFWYKEGVAPAGSDRAGKPCRWVADRATAGYELYPAFLDGGVEIDQYYFGAYECSDDGGTKAASVAGAAPLVSINFATMQARCAARNTGGVDGFAMVDIYQLAAVQLLCLIETGTADVQSAIGAGNTSSSAAVNTGTTNAVWRGIYELWGNVWCMVDGLILETDHEVKIWDKNGNRTLQATGVITTSTDGWVKSMHDDEGVDWDLGLVFLPEVTDGSSANSTYGDYLYASDLGETNVCYHGGAWSHGALAGLFHLHLSHVASNASTGVGSRLAKV